MWWKNSLNGLSNPQNQRHMLTQQEVTFFQRFPHLMMDLTEAVQALAKEVKELKAVIEKAKE